MTDEAAGEQAPKRTWAVTFHGLATHDVVVDAATREEAVEKANAHFDDNRDYEVEWDRQGEDNPSVEEVGP